VVRAIQRRQLAEHGGREGVRDPGLLDSALARPRQLFAYAQPPPDLAALAAAYAFGLLRNHPFVDGNKRAALVVLRTFLKLNGRDLVASQEEKYRMVMGLAEGGLSEEAFADWNRANLG
jgi:death-on-curing protein